MIYKKCVLQRSLIEFSPNKNHQTKTEGVFVNKPSLKLKVSHQDVATTQTPKW